MAERLALAIAAARMAGLRAPCAYAAFKPASYAGPSP